MKNYVGMIYVYSDRPKATRIITQQDKYCYGGHTLSDKEPISNDISILEDQIRSGEVIVISRGSAILNDLLSILN